MNCPECGNPIPPDSPEGHCPHCLLQHAATSANSEAGLEGSEPKPPGASGRPQVPAQPIDIVRYMGDYELLEEIARGGMGVVYKARQVSLNRVVAVKMILAGRLAGEVEVRRFLTEAEAAANLQHANIVAIHEIGQHQGQHYFSMDYVNGPNLAQWAKAKAVSPPQAAGLLLTIARAVHFAHQRGTLHRDLKPHNVLIDESGQPRITDFGLAKRTTQSSQLTQEGAVMGSPSYMPPEQAVGRHDLVGPASDVYALGAILYELLTGRPPFGPGPFTAVLRQVIEDEPAAPSQVNRLVPADLETICLKCLEKRPERRYATARDLAEELERFLNQEPILARPASSIRKAWNWLVRNPWLLMGATTVLMLGLIGLAYGLWEQNRFLVWTQTHSATAAAKPGAALSLPLIFLLVFAGFLGAPLSFADFVDRKRRGFALGQRQSWIYGGFGAFFVVGAIAFTLALIHDWIWRLRLPERSNHPWVFLFSVLVCAWFGGLLLFHVVREFRISSLGLRPANEDELFPPAPRQSRFTVADRRGLNLLLVAVLLVVWLFRFLFPDALARHMCLFVASIAAEVPIGIAFYRLTRKSANRHAVLWFTAVCVIMSLSFLRAMGEWDQEASQRLTATMIGFSLGAVMAVCMTRLETAATEGVLAVREEAWFEWWVQKPDRAGSLTLCMLVGIVAVSALLGGVPVRAPLATIIGLMAILPHEIACWRRAAGRERQGRGHTVGLITISALSTAFGLPSVLSAGCAVAGLLIGLVFLAFIHTKSRGLPKA